eukprot:3892164-Rhodomonas_salina.1
MLARLPPLSGILIDEVAQSAEVPRPIYHHNTHSTYPNPPPTTSTLSTDPNFPSIACRPGRGARERGAGGAGGARVFAGRACRRPLSAP